MKQPLRRLTAALTLTAAAFTGYALIDGLTSTPPDTGWGAPAHNTPLDTGWGTPPTGHTGGPSVTPYDTGWG